MGLPAAAEGGLGVAGGGALEIRVGEIVKRDGDRQSEQILDAAEPGVLDFVAMAHEKIGGPVKLHQGHGIEVHAEKFAEGAAFARPAPCGEFAARGSHPPDQAAGDSGPLDPIEAEAGKDRIDAQPLHGGETGGFHTGGPRLDELQRGDIDFGEDRVWRGGLGGQTGRPRGTCRWRGLRRGGTWPGDDEAGGVTLCQGFDGLGFREHAGLPGEQGLDPRAQARPIALGEIELAAEVEQGDLADLFADAFGGDETEREVGFAGGFIPGRGFADEHGWRLGWRPERSMGLRKYYGTTKVLQKLLAEFRAFSGVRYGVGRKKC